MGGYQLIARHFSRPQHPVCSHSCVITSLDNLNFPPFQSIAEKFSHSNTHLLWTKIFTYIPTMECCLKKITQKSAGKAKKITAIYRVVRTKNLSNGSHFWVLPIGSIQEISTIILICTIIEIYHTYYNRLLSTPRYIPEWHIFVL